MTTLPADHASGGHAHDHGHHHEIGFVRKYIFSMDHKVIGIQFLFTSLLMMVVGGLFALAVRWQIAWPFDLSQPIPFADAIGLAKFEPAMQGVILSGDTYNMLFSMHATFMIFFVIIPLLMGAFANLLIPLQIGTRDMAFPLLNMLSFWVSFAATGVMLASLAYGAGQAGWTSYPPLSHIASHGQSIWLISVLLVGSSSLMGAINYITTILNLRAPGMTLFRMPLTTWSFFINAILILMSTPVLTVALLMLLFDRHLGTTFFTISPAMRSGEVASTLDGGQPLLWQHLFWFYSHPAVYIMILPAMGMTSDILSTFCRKPIFGYKPMVFAVCAIAFLGYIVWGHHMFASGMNPLLGTTFMASTILIAVPSAIKTFNWLGTMWGAQIRFTPALLFAVGFVSMFAIGGLSGIFMAAAPVDIYFHDTYFIVGHIHYVLFGGSLFAIFGGIYYWYPKMFGCNMNQRLGVLHFWLTFIAFNLTFFLMHIVGVGAHPRRYATILSYPSLEFLQPLNIVMTIGALMLGMGMIPFVINFFCSLGRYGNRVIVYALILAVIEMIPGFSLFGMIFNWGGVSFMLPLLGLVLCFALLALIDSLITSAVGMWSPAANRAIVALTWIIALPLFMLPVFGKGDFWEWINVNSTTYVMSPDAYRAGPQQPYPMSIDASATEASSTLMIEATGEPAQTPIVNGFLINAPDLFEDAADAGVTITGTPLAEMANERASKARQFEISTDELAALPEQQQALVNDNRVMVAGWIAEIAKQNLIPGHKVSRTWKSPLNQEFHIITWSGVMLGRLIALAFVVAGLAMYFLWGRREPGFAAKVGSNPWKANSLEWYATSPPWYENFPTLPVVHRGPYEFASPAAHHVGRGDHIMQTDVLPPHVEEPTGH